VKFTNKVLIVDDEEDIHLLLKFYLEKMKDIEILSAYSAEEAVKIYEELLNKGEEPLVIMDLNLSGEDEIERKERFEGIEATKKILKMDSKAIIWGYTAWEDTEAREKLRKAGAKEVFSRDIPFKKFAEMINNFFNKNR